VIPGERRPSADRVRCDGCLRFSPPTPVGQLPEGWTKQDMTRALARFCPACSTDGQGKRLLLARMKL
jgi:hypothetical protein